MPLINSDSPQALQKNIAAEEDFDRYLSKEINSKQFA
jgi:hypothetical protein